MKKLKNKPNLHYLNCDHCGYEDFEIFAEYRRQTASDNLYICPKCGLECWNIITVEEAEQKEIAEEIEFACGRM